MLMAVEHVAHWSLNDDEAAGPATVARLPPPLLSASGTVLWSARPAQELAWKIQCQATNSSAEETSH